MKLRASILLRSLPLFLFLISEFLPPVVQGSTIQSQSSATSLLELFTSEGCSSCPPADKWLSGLQTRPGLWRDFVPVGFHVTYWDDLGWKDRLGSYEYTKRQRKYADQWKAPSIYTPGVVLNGEEWRGWAGSRSIPENLLPSPGRLEIRVEDDDEFIAVFYPESQARDLSVSFTLLGFGIHSDIKKGENRGRQLQHNFAVLDFKEVRLLKKDGRFSAVVKLKSQKEMAPERSGVAAWVTQKGSMKPLQAAGGYLD